MSDENTQVQTPPTDGNQLPNGSEPLTAPPNPPTNQPVDLKAELANLNLGALSSLHQENARLQALLAERNATPASPARDDDAASFLANPRQAVREEMQALVKPLYDFIGGVQKRTAYDDLKDRYKSLPQFGKVLADHEEIVDRLMQGNEVNETNLQASIFAAVGMKATGVIPGGNAPPVNAPTPNNPPAQPVNNNPPYIPPSPPAPPRNAPPAANDLKSKVDALTEQERQVAKIFGMKLEEYVTLRDADTEVANWNREGK